MSFARAFAVMAVIAALAAFVLPAPAFSDTAHKKHRHKARHKVHAARAARKKLTPHKTAVSVKAAPAPDKSIITIIDKAAPVLPATPVPAAAPAIPDKPAVDKHVPSATPSRAQARPPDTERGLKLLDRYDGADLGTLDEAEALFNKALKSDPKDALALVGLSRVEMCRGYVADGRFDDRRLTYALTLTDRALDIAPGSGPAHLQRGYLFLYLDSLGLAEAEADKAAKAGAAASRLYGEAAMRRGDADKARALWEKAITEAGDNDGEKADSYDALGEVCMAGGDYQAAAGYFRKALILRPNSSWEASNYGLALVHMGRFDEAIEALTLSLAHKDFPEARANLAVAYLRKGVSLNDRGDTAQAEACYRSAINCDPLLMLAYKDLAALYERTGKVEKAAELCRKAMERNPGDPWAAETLKGLGQGKP